jgi:hypothetical protein
MIPIDTVVSHATANSFAQFACFENGLPALADADRALACGLPDKP